MFLMDFLFSVIGVLLAVAFFTLMERKIMGISQYRKGPNKIMISGISQPMADALKLLSKEMMKTTNSKTYMYMMGPMVSIMILISCWSWFNYLFNTNATTMKMMMIIATMSLSSYTFLLTSWGSNSKYSILGGHRAVAQIISYEVCLVIFLLAVIYINKSYSMKMMKILQENMWIAMSFFPIFMIWVMMCMAESNRTPFDLAEGESEIVSGFNIEYGSGLFAMIFISEYGMIMFISFLTSLMFLGASSEMVKTLVMCTTFVWVRCTFPRLRYDKLMSMCWKMALPLSILTVLVSTSMM